MIKPEQIPDEVRLALKETLFSGPAHDIYATALAAALNAWPGAFRNDMEEAAGVRRRIILPLAQKQEDGDGR